MELNEGQESDSVEIALLLNINLAEAKQFAEIFLSCKLVKSKSEAIRLLKQGAVYVYPGNQENTIIFKLGKHRFAEMVYK